jgi:CARDB
MRRIAPIIVCFAALAAPAQASQSASVALTACAPDERAAEFEARMAAIEGAARMKMRFTLQVRKPGKSGFRRVAAPGFDVWSTAGAGKRRYVFTRRVEALIGPASYRAIVRFRWVDVHGKTITNARAHSRACRQPDHRANLTVRALSVEGARRYVALVANTGRSASGPFDLQVELPDETLGPVTVDGLDPREQRLVRFRGPRCKTGTSITATADPVDVLDERSETDNALTVTCD